MTEEKKSVTTELMQRIANYYGELITVTLGIEYKAPGYYQALTVFIIFSVLFAASIFIAMSRGILYFTVPSILLTGVIVYAVKAKKKYGQKDQRRVNQ
jgi:hypothetical protein